MGGGQLRKAVVPPRRRPVSGGSVNDAGGGTLDEAHRLHGRRVRQAQKHDIHPVHQLFPLRRVLPLILVNEEKVDVAPGGKPVVDLKAGGALLAVDVYLWSHDDPPCGPRDN